MKLHELIKQLESFDPELEVFVRSHEFGFKIIEPTFIYPVEMTLTEWAKPRFDGLHDIDRISEQKVKGLVIDRDTK